MREVSFHREEDVGVKEGREVAVNEELMLKRQRKGEGGKNAIV